MRTKRPRGPPRAQLQWLEDLIGLMIASVLTILGQIFRLIVGRGK
jgi:hypothetical protein